MTDRYTKTVLTVIAGALLYLCIVMTPFPAAQAQSQRPGEISSGPIQVIVTGWKTEPLPVAFQRPVPVVTLGSDVLRINGSVTTERSSGRADRVVLVGWEENAIRDSPSSTPLRTITQNVPGFPVQQK